MAVWGLRFSTAWMPPFAYGFIVGTSRRMYCIGWTRQFRSGRLAFRLFYLDEKGNPHELA